jgi:short-subunit dehydrogenase
LTFSWGYDRNTNYLTDNKRFTEDKKMSSRGENKKTALVTGASSGIGEVFAKELQKEGYLVTCVARSKDKLEALVKQLGEGHRFIAADLANPEQLEEVVLDIKKNKYNLLINNAGYGLYKRFHEIPLEKHEHLMAVNINAVVHLSHAYLENAVSGDALINVSSALSRLTYPGGAVYAGAKGFVTIFTESLWYEYKDKGIYVMALLPGVTYTNFQQVAFEGKIDPSLQNSSMGYPPEVVVSEGLKALKKRKTPSLVSGPKIRFLTGFITRLLGRKRMIALMAARNPALK